MSAPPRLRLLAANVKTASFEQIDLVERPGASEGWRVLASRSLETGFAAAEVVAAIQADRAPGDGEALHLQARASRNQTRWTPWLELARWRGANAPELPPALRPKQSDPLGRVDVDKAVLAPNSMARFAQLRIVVAGSIEPRGASLSARDKAPWTPDAEPPRAASALDLARLPEPFRQHDLDPEIGARICSASSCAWAIRALLGRDDAADPLALARAAFDAEHDLYGNWPRAIFAASSISGGALDASLRYVGSMAEAAELLASGAVVVASIRWSEGELPGASLPKSDGHLVALIALDPARGVALAFDPAQPADAPFPTAYPLDAFASCWLGKSAVAYALRRR